MTTDEWADLLKSVKGRFEKGGRRKRVALMDDPELCLLIYDNEDANVA